MYSYVGLKRYLCSLNNMFVHLPFWSNGRISGHGLGRHIKIGIRSIQKGLSSGWLCLKYQTRGGCASPFQRTSASSTIFDIKTAIRAKNILYIGIRKYLNIIPKSKPIFSYYYYLLYILIIITFTLNRVLSFLTYDYCTKNQEYSIFLPFIVSWHLLKFSCGTTKYKNELNDPWRLTQCFFSWLSYAKLYHHEVFLKE